MKQVGEVLHLSKSGNLIVKLQTQQAPPLNSLVFTSSQNKLVGKVVDVMGPVASPYLAVKPEIDKPEKLAGVKIYVEERKGLKRKKRR